MSSSGTSNEPTVKIWSDGRIRQATALLVSDVDTGHQAAVHVDVVDFSDDQDPTVALSVQAHDSHCLYFTACDAERIGTFLIQAAAISRQVEPGGPNPLLNQQFPT